MAPVNLLMPCV